MLIAFVVFLPFLFAGLSCFAGDIFLILSSGAELLLALPLVFGRAELTIPGILAGGLNFMTDGFRSVYAVIAAFMWFFTAPHLCGFLRRCFPGNTSGRNRRI